MVDYFVATAPLTPYVPGSGSGVRIETFNAAPPDAPIAPQIEQLRSLLTSGGVQAVRAFLLKMRAELGDFEQFNSLLLSANSGEHEQSEVCMDVILKSINEAPIVRLVDSRGDFCVVRFDRPAKAQVLG
ncbi:MAG TPA: hypothetical protein V6C97_04350 [Oculatellaceae cyanobacterium]